MFAVDELANALMISEREPHMLLRQSKAEVMVR